MITRITTTSERSFCVGTSSMFIAVMGTKAALVHVYGDKTKLMIAFWTKMSFKSFHRKFGLFRWIVLEGHCFILYCLSLSFCFNWAPVESAQWCVSEENLNWRIAQAAINITWASGEVSYTNTKIQNKVYLTEGKRIESIYKVLCATLISCCYLYSWPHRRYNPLGTCNKTNHLYWCRCHRHDNYVCRLSIHRYLRKVQWSSFKSSKFPSVFTIIDNAYPHKKVITFPKRHQ